MIGGVNGDRRGLLIGCLFLFSSYADYAKKDCHMASYIVNLPSLGDDAGDEAQVSFVYVNAGDAVAEEADLIEMVTDKATFNVPSPKAGKIVKMAVSEGDTVKVGQPICEMEI